MEAQKRPRAELKLTRRKVDETLESSFQFGSGRLRRGVVQRYVATRLGTHPTNQLAKLVTQSLEAHGVEPMRATGLQYYRNISFRYGV